MKLTALGSAIRTIVWAEVALTAALGTSVAFAQSQPAAQGASSTAAAPAGASGAAASSKTATPATGEAAKTSGHVQKLQRFEVTGSLIRQSDKVGFNQVQTVTAKEIQQSGASSVADFLRNTSANSANSWSEGQTGNFAAGAAGMALRGLSEKYTLVLVDGQRVAPFAAFSNTVDSFFDLNTLPLNDIERIEIVKTGAVSQYGSDAIAGVVNIITKHNFHGVQLDGSYGSAINGGNGQGTTKFGILAGFGNLNSDRFNVTAAASVYQSSGFTLADRDSTRNEDWTGKPGGYSVLAPSYWNMPDGSAQALSSCAYGGMLRPAATNSLTPGMAGTLCGINTASGMSILPQTQRLNAKVHADFKIDDKTTFYIAVSAEIPTLELVDTVPLRFKVGAPDDVEKCVLSALPGVRLQYAPQMPAAVPVRPDTCYFVLDAKGQMYERMLQAQSMAIYVPSGMKGLKLELLAVAA